MIADVLVVGAGPAGVSAALWAREYDLGVVVLEGAELPGGQLHNIHFAPRDWAGIAAGDGITVAATMALQLADRGVEVRCGAAALAFESPRPGEPAAVRTADGARHQARTVLVATGLRRRRLEVPGERELEGRGVSTSATRDRARLAGRAVMVVGGGDAAFENALILADAGCAVTLAVRGAPRARAEFRDRVAASPRIQVLHGARVLAIEGGGEVRAVRLADGRGERLHAVDAVVVKVGAIPNTEWCAGALVLDERGYLPVDEHQRTVTPGVWGAGDVTHPVLPSLPVALAQGALAVADIRAVLRADIGAGRAPAGRAGRD
jgi:thioredoxin reductase (NADPH)